ncbi:MAG: hypothetical protein EBR30_29325, partial [Cytophagia bacterium]|nr:hypothetical protein [Cytophagia bacterium]
MKTWILIVTFVIVSIELAFTQHQDPIWSVRRATINQQCIAQDSLCHVLHKLGTFEGHLRTFFMGTTNYGNYPNYYALGVGGGLGYYSPIINNFQVGMSGFIIYNMTSSHLGPRDGFNNRYELGLKIKLKGGFLWKTSPRGTIHWYDIGKSIGVYPMGRATNGAKADYAGHVKTKGIALANLSVLPHKNIKSELWNYFVPDLQHTLYTKTEWRKKNEQIQWMTGLQYLWQRSLFNDTLALERQYVGRNEQAHVVSARITRAHVRTGSEWSISYTRITKHGRFLFPREWGIEPFYTFMQRERIEGSGGTHALLLQH